MQNKNKSPNVIEIEKKQRVIAIDGSFQMDKEKGKNGKKWVRWFFLWPHLTLSLFLNCFVIAAATYIWTSCHLASLLYLFLLFSHDGQTL